MAKRIVYSIMVNTMCKATINMTSMISEVANRCKVNKKMKGKRDSKRN